LNDEAQHEDGTVFVGQQAGGVPESQFSEIKMAACDLFGKTKAPKAKNTKNIIIFNFEVFFFILMLRLRSASILSSSNGLIFDF